MRQFSPYKQLLLLPLLAFSLQLSTAAASHPTLAAASVLQIPERPAADREADALRKPTELLDFVKLKPGQTVLELLPGGGYFTRLFSQRVGLEGQVHALVPQPRAHLSEKFQEILTEGYQKMLALATSHPNVRALSQDLAQLALPEAVDLVWTSQNYHDMYGYWGPEVTAAVNRAIFEALKPGGIYLVIDHRGSAADPEAPTTLHRIDPELVKQQVLAAGFVLAAESPLLHNPDDRLALSVFAPELRGRTDQFVLKFRKP